MNFVQAIQSGFRNYVNFTGRAARSELWWWILFQMLALFTAAILAGLIRFPLLYSLVALGLFLPGIAVIVRRLHDTERSGWWYFLALIPLVGAIILIVWFCKQGTTGTNRFGADPLLAGGVDASVFSPASGPSDTIRRG